MIPLPIGSRVPNGHPPLSSAGSFARLPKEVILKILGLKELLNLGATSSHLYTLFKDNFFWEHFVRSRFPDVKLRPPPSTNNHYYLDLYQDYAVGIKIGSYLSTTLETESPILCSHLQDGFFCAGFGDGSVIIWDIERSSKLHTLKGHTDRIRCLALSREVLYTGSEDQYIIGWDLKSGEKQAIFPTDGSIHVLKIQNEHLYAAVAAKVLIWNLDTKELVRTLDTDHIPTAPYQRIIDLHIEGHLLSAQLLHNTIIKSSHMAVAWDLKEDLPGYYASSPTPHCFSQCMHKNLVYIGPVGNDVLFCWNFKEDTTEFSNDLHLYPKEITCLTTSDDLLIAGFSDGTVVAWDVNMRRIRYTLHNSHWKRKEGTSWGKKSVTLLSIQNNLLSALLEDTLVIWDLETGQKVHTFTQTHLQRSYHLHLQNSRICAVATKKVLIWHFSPRHRSNPMPLPPPKYTLK
jgi:WD40 repeat protein